MYITLGTVKSGVASAVGTGPVSVGLGGTWDMGGFETTIYSLSVDGTLTNLGGVISTNDITLGDSGEMAELTILQNQYLDLVHPNRARPEFRLERDGEPERGRPLQPIRH